MISYLTSVVYRHTSSKGTPFRLFGMLVFFLVYPYMTVTVCGSVFLSVSVVILISQTSFTGKQRDVLESMHMD